MVLAKNQRKRMGTNANSVGIENHSNGKENDKIFFFTNSKIISYFFIKKIVEKNENEDAFFFLV